MPTKSETGDQPIEDDAATLRRELAGVRQTLEAVQELANVGVWSFDTETQSGSWSASLFEMFERDPSLGEPAFPEFLDLIHPEDRDSLIEHQARALVEGNVSFRFRSNPKNGAIRFFASTIDRVGEQTLSGSILEETDRIMLSSATAQLRETKRADQALDQLSRLSDGLAHNLNNILAVVLTNVEYLRQHFSLRPDARQGPDSAADEAFDDVREALDRATELSRNMQATAGGRRLRLGSTDLSLVVARSVSRARSVAGDRASIDVELGELPLINGDRGELEKLVGVLLTNAIEASLEDESQGTVVSVTAGVAPSTDLKDEQVWIEVRDLGPGMSDDIRARAFEPFFSTKFQGRGLGLAAARGIARAHGGSIWLASGRGLGTRVRVELPNVAFSPRAVS